MSQILQTKFMYFMQPRHACTTSFTRPSWLVVASSTFGMMYDYIRLHMQATDISEYTLQGHSILQVNVFL